MEKRKPWFNPSAPWEIPSIAEALYRQSITLFMTLFLRHKVIQRN
jgi:hypothetical protein